MSAELVAHRASVSVRPHDDPDAMDDERPTIVDPNCVPAPWWRRLGRWLARLMRPVPSLPELPPIPSPVHAAPSAYSRAAMLEEVFHFLWRVELGSVRAVGRLALHILAVRSHGLDGATEAHVCFVLSRLQPDNDGTIALPGLRDRMMGVPNDAVDRALLQLEARGLIELLPALSHDDVRGRGAAIQHRTRGKLSRCVVREVP